MTNWCPVTAITANSDPAETAAEPLAYEREEDTK
jgi:hypothetical protein